MNKNIICNSTQGLCTNNRKNSNMSAPQTQKAKIIYFTDPICSACWGIEAPLRKLKLEYGHLFNIEYHMGGLLPDWSYNSGGISKPADVAEHWNQASKHYNMPIDGRIWLEDPLDSSYPPSIAFKAAQIQNPQKAILFLRAMREMVFMHKKNIGKWENINKAALKVGLDIKQLQTDVSGNAQKNFQSDLVLTQSYGVRGFPTMFITNQNKQAIVYGAQAYQKYEQAIKKTTPQAIKKIYDTNWKFLFSQYPSLTAQEFSVLTNKSKKESQKQLNALTEQGILQKHTIENGSIWSLKHNPNTKR